MSRTRVGSAAAAAGLAALGLVVGVLATVQHRRHLTWAGIDVPWGLVLALAATWLVAVAAGSVARRGASWFAIGWALHLVIASRGGDYLVASDTTGWVYTVVALLGLVLVVADPLRRRARTSGRPARGRRDDPARPT